MIYKDLAPTFERLGVTEKNLTDVKKADKVANVKPSLTKTKALAVLAEFNKDAVPYTGLAQKHGLTSSQVRALHQEWLAVRVKADYVAPEEL